MIAEGYSVRELTKAAGVSRQAYYKWLKHDPNEREIEELELLKLIKQLENNIEQNSDTIALLKSLKEFLLQNIFL